MSITATYVSSTSFTVSDDKTDDFIPGRALMMDCGVDGTKYGYISYSSFSSPDTTVYLDTTDSQDITNNLASVQFSVVKYQAVGGNNALETLWLTRGLQTIQVIYKDADEITLRPGTLNINDGSTEALYRSNGFDKQITSPSNSTIYYVYIKAPSNGRVLSANEVEFSTTAPSFVTEKQGYYHPSNAGWRCIFAVYINGSGAISEFFMVGGNKVYFAENILSDHSNAQPSNTWVDQTLTVPLWGSNPICICRFALAYVNADAYAYWRTNGSSSAGFILAWVNSGAGEESVWAEVKCDSSGIIETKWGSSTTNYLSIHTLGFTIPHEIFSAG